MTEKYRVHELVRFNYSDIGEYVGEYHTDRPLRNDILVDLLNNQDDKIKELQERNDRQRKRLDDLYQLILNRDYTGQEELIKRLKTIREEQTETILKQKRKIKELETRNKRQYERLKERTDLMCERQWGKLENMVEEWEKQEKLLNQEWSNCGDE